MRGECISVGDFDLCHSQNLEVKVVQAARSLSNMWMDRLGQADSLQGPYSVSCGDLAVDMSGTGTGW